MCGTCGCSDPDGVVTIRRPGSDTEHQQLHNHGQPHHHGHGHNRHDHSHTDGHEHGHSHSHSHDHSHDHGHHHHHGHSHGHGHGHSHSHGHPHEHSHTHSHGETREIQLEQDILAHNNTLAERNRGYFEAKNITALNFVSSPGAGKTTLLEKTIEALREDIPFAVIEGDQQTMNDA
ncbi:MAG: GTP-binding protein, partial [Cyclonatronaceae bacterium]